MNIWVNEEKDWNGSNAYRVPLLEKCEPYSIGGILHKIDVVTWLEIFTKICIKQTIEKNTSFITKKDSRNQTYNELGWEIWI